MRISEERIRYVLDKVANKLQIKQWSYIQEDIDTTIENYFGVLVPVKLIGTNKYGKVEKPMFLKFAPNDVVEELKLLIQHYYCVEMYTYCQLLPKYKLLSIVDVQQFIPECYYADLKPNNEVLVLKDIRCESFKPYKGNRLLDFDHVNLSLQTLAIFHALSIILKIKGNEFGNNIMKPYTNKHFEVYFDYIRDSLNNNMHVFKNTVYEKYLNSLVSNLAIYVNCATSKAKYLVYGHGDYWKENILFKYENSKPIKACMLDFQKTRTMSPAQDILHFLLTNAECNNVDQHKQYLQIYLDQLHRTLSSNGINNVYTAADLEYDMKIIAPNCVALAAMGFSLWLGLQRDSIVESKQTGADINKSYAIFKTKMTEMLNHLNNLEYICLI